MNTLGASFPTTAQILCSNSGCPNLATITSRCSNCRKAIYCGENCHMTHWKRHRFLCQIVIPNDQRPENKKSASTSDIDAAKAIRLGQPDSFKEAEMYMKEGKLYEALDFFPFIPFDRRDRFLEEFMHSNHPKTVAIAIKLYISGRKEEAKKIMRNFPEESDQKQYTCTITNYLA